MRLAVERSGFRGFQPPSFMGLGCGFGILGLSVRTVEALGFRP